MSRYPINGKNAGEIAASIEHAMHAGGWDAGHRLPTIRELASTLRVSPVTVASAYRSLQGRGLVTGGGRHGTRVRGHGTDVHHAPTEQIRQHDRPGRAFEGAVGLDLASGNPDPDLLPGMGPHLQQLAHIRHPYGEPMDYRPLVAFAQAEFESDGIPPAHITVTNGTLDAVERVMREHLRPGDHVLVEDPTQPALRDLLGALGLAVHGCAVDDEGPEVEAFERAYSARIRAVLVSPRAQNPTGAAMTSARAEHLGRILRRRPQAVLIEIDSAGPVAGASAVTLIDSSRTHWAVIRSTSKFLNPDLRVAVMATDLVTSARVQRRQALGVRWVSHLSQALAHALWSDPSTGRGLARAAEVYRQRRRALIEALEAHGVTAHGKSGFNVWVPVRQEASTASELATRGWVVAAGELFRLHSSPALRITTSALTVDLASRLVEDLSDIMGSPTSASA